MTDYRNDPIDTQSADYLAARRQVRRLRGWYKHATVYALVNAGLWLWYLADLGNAWGHHAWHSPLRVTLFWGLGLAIHGASVWTRVSRAGRDWEERKTRELMARR